MKKRGYYICQNVQEKCNPNHTASKGEIKKKKKHPVVEILPGNFLFFFAYIKKEGVMDIKVYIMQKLNEL